MRFALPLAGLLAVGIVLPLLAHLLSRRPPTPRPFPTLRFLRATPTAARRLRALHDPALWALRTVIVLVVTGAAAGPTLVTAGRAATWRPPVVRALVIGPELAAPAADAGADETTWVYASRPLRDSLAAALADLARRTDAPREIVVRWSGSRQALDAPDLESIPADLGLRLELTEAADSASGAAPLDIQAAPDDDDARAFVIDVVRWAASSHAPRVTWPGAPARTSFDQEATPASPRIAEVFRRMRHDPRLADAAQRSRLDPRVAPTTGERLDRARFAPLARDEHGVVLLWGAMSGDRPLLVLDARVTDPLALWSLRVADDAARSAEGWPGPAARWTSAETRAVERTPSVPAGPLPGGLDTRWWWLAALALVVVEGVVRRRPGASIDVAHAAAEDNDVH